LGGNNLRGELPANIFAKVTRLTELDIGKNEFEGQLPTTVGNLKDMSKFYEAFG
jgi:hypothetical protein